MIEKNHKLRSAGVPLAHRFSRRGFRRRIAVLATDSSRAQRLVRELPLSGHVMAFSGRISPPIALIPNSPADTVPRA
jgi:hypothetical protein